MKYYITVLVISFALFFPNKSNAVVPVPFGGYNVWSVPCTCSAGVVWYVWYAPLFLDMGVPMAGPMAVGVPPSSYWFLDYDPIVPTTWSLGMFVAGVQSCWQPGPTVCIPWPVLGHVYEVGSSPPLTPP